MGWFGWGRRAAGRKTRGARRERLVALASTLPLCRGLPPDKLSGLAGLGAFMLDDKSFTAAGGLAWHDGIGELIALQAALPALELGEAALEGWREIIVYPDAFVARDLWVDDAGVMHDGEQVLVGQARHDGPVVLSAPDAADSPLLDGWNVVIHEIAHKLDMLSGDANGCPPLHKGMSRDEWAQDWGRDFERFNAMLDAGREHWLDPYAAEHPAEFFAVLSESFFEAPHWVRDDFPALYRQLSLFYRQDPAARLARLPLSVLLPGAGHGQGH
ncbi:zinc-dependent peptidase [Crenobacter cavernae]|uniref:Zinc-dependent peptidase n=1 Tax=Crenobacter cavernae TaxID=2290923 RepID=A0ABY0F9L6_9NEIS|nr:M90 family metallopeptidase [Crenobacter cavernae]RXZ42098.1 zinc-dependent peptidase [Crenobacter cavernae]